MGAKELIKKLAKDNAKEHFEIFGDSKLTNIDEWISTGSYSFNKVISGSYFRGIPHGRVTGLAGACVDENTIITAKVNGEIKELTIKELFEIAKKM